jgi:dTMP kinase
MDACIWRRRGRRAPQTCHFKTPAELLTLASIVEKETGRASDRAHDRVGFCQPPANLGMPLQTDPTVIYGMGEAPLTAICGAVICRLTHPGIPTPEADCRPHQLPCQARQLCWQRLNQRQVVRCILSHAETAAVSSVTIWRPTTVLLTSFNVASDSQQIPMISPGLFISFEGIDGAGKSTHINALAEAFQAQGRVVTLTREPGGTPLAEKLRALVLNDAMDPMTEALLVFAARRDHLQQLIEPALARGEVVLCDRFTDATFAYQGGGRGFDLETLRYLEHLVQTTIGLGGNFVRQPDLTVWFELAPEVAAQRLAQSRGTG